MPTQPCKIRELMERFKALDRTALAKIITIVESTAAHDRDAKEHILREFLALKKDAIRVAISGPPGVGKSTFINVLGQKLIDRGYSIAILPIDPSSDMSLGSILADKTRMKELLAKSKSYIRPSPSKRSLGGVALSTEDVILVTEAFGFDFVIIETVGVGQSETVARSLSDHFILLMQPGSGDELQAMKMGILEKADFILVNKADGEQTTLAKKTKSSLKALSLRQNKDHAPYVSTISALSDVGISDFLDELLRRHQTLVTSDLLAISRKKNRLGMFDYTFEQIIAERLKQQESIAKIREQITQGPDFLDPLSTVVNRLADDICRKLSE